MENGKFTFEICITFRRGNARNAFCKSENFAYISFSERHSVVVCWLWIRKQAFFTRGISFHLSQTLQLFCPSYLFRELSAILIGLTLNRRAYYRVFHIEMIFSKRPKRWKKNSFLWIHGLIFKKIVCFLSIFAVYKKPF